MPKTYDPACYDLAEQFLSDTPYNSEANREHLARSIQQTIEDELADLEASADEPDPDAQREQPRSDVMWDRQMGWSDAEAEE